MFLAKTLVLTLMASAMCYLFHNQLEWRMESSDSPGVSHMSTLGFGGGYCPQNAQCVFREKRQWIGPAVSAWLLGSQSSKDLQECGTSYS